jgi:hypothetical protein
MGNIQVIENEKNLNNQFIIIIIFILLLLGDQSTLPLIG